MTNELDTDVVVIGAGPGGMAVAIEASNAGAEVVVIERSPNVGGNGAMSTGYVAMANTEAQRAQGIRDSAELFLNDMLAEVERQRANHGIVFDVDLARLYAEKSSETYEFLQSHGLEFVRLIPRPGQHTVPRMHAIATPSKFETLLSDTTVDVRLSTGAMRLLGDSRAVHGVLAMDERRMHTFEISARKGVVVASGSYQASTELRRRLQPASMSTTPYIGLPTCQGDGHLMADAVGGDLMNMTVIPMIVSVGSRLVEECIAVNRAGSRFHDEAGPYTERKAALQDQDTSAHYICDNQTFRNCEDIIHMMPGEPVRARTIRELAAAIGVPADGLSDTVHRWNEFLQGDSDIDPDFNRVVLPAGRRKLSEPPYAALPMAVGATFGFGGLRTSRDMAVANAFGETVPGLYAVGDCAGGVLAAQELGGIHLGAAVTLGRIAGATVAGAR